MLARVDENLPQLRQLVSEILYINKNKPANSKLKEARQAALTGVCRQRLCWHLIATEDRGSFSPSGCLQALWVLVRTHESRLTFHTLLF